MRWFLSLIALVIISGFSCADNNSTTPPNNTEPGNLTLSELITGLNQPVFMTSPPDDSVRLFIVEQTGKIKVLNQTTSAQNTFLDLTAKIAYGGEMGLLGLAFHPDYRQNGYFYVNYTQQRSGNIYSRVERYTVAADPESAIPDSDTLIMEVGQPYGNHNAGMLTFGPDGYLYIGWGDGGSGGDPHNNAQNPLSPLGKMLRIDVDNSLPYTIPNSNPFYNNPDTLPEIWALGLRNPWRYCFDRSTGDLWIADVGQGEIEEIDFQPAGSIGGENYGWRLKEGTACYNPGTNCDNGLLTDPIHQYTHGGTPFRCSITGGYVYRGIAIPGLQGEYFFADYCSNQIWSLKRNGADVSLTAYPELVTSGISSFGEDYYGELYVVSLSQGKVFKIIEAN